MVERRQRDVLDFIVIIIILIIILIIIIISRPFKISHSALGWTW